MNVFGRLLSRLYFIDLLSFSDDDFGVYLQFILDKNKYLFVIFLMKHTEKNF